MALAWLALAPGSALADNGYEAQFVGRSPDLTLESGELATSSFQARNVGTKPWQTDRAVAPPVRLGASNPRDRTSAFRLPEWVNDDRPAAVAPEPVLPGQQGTFTFRVRAPVVGSTTVFTEYFEPVADAIPGDIGGWMGSNVGLPNWPINGIPIAYRVIPARPPAVQIDAQPGSALRGTKIRVAATGTDNVRVNRLELRLADRPPVTAAAPADQATLTTAAELDTAGLPAGDHPLEVTAVDGAGLAASAKATLALADPPPVANGANATRNAKLTAGFGRRRPRSRTTVSYGRTSTLRGRLVGEGGAAISGATVKVSTRVLSGRRGFRELSVPLTTDAEGRVEYEVPPGASRHIRLGYTAFSTDPGPATTRTVRFSTRAGVRLSVSPTRVRNGRRVRLSGQLRGGHLPGDGVLVTLQGRQPGFGWRTFTTVRSRKRGRFASSYRFRTIRRTTTVRFRAVMRRQTGYPYTTGGSPELRVRVRP
jgi:hypothetical protein